MSHKEAQRKALRRRKQEMFPSWRWKLRTAVRPAPANFSTGSAAPCSSTPFQRRQFREGQNTFFLQLHGWVFIPGMNIKFPSSPPPGLPPLLPAPSLPCSGRQQRTRSIEEDQVEHLPAPSANSTDWGDRGSLKLHWIQRTGMSEGDWRHQLDLPGASV